MITTFHGKTMKQTYITIRQYQLKNRNCLLKTRCNLINQEKKTEHIFKKKVDMCEKLMQVTYQMQLGSSTFLHL